MKEMSTDNDLSSTSTRLARRRFLKKAIGFGAGITFSGMTGLGAAQQRRPGRNVRPNVRLARTRTSTWFEPEVIWSNDNGELEANLRINYFDRDIGPDPLRLRLYESRAVSADGEIKPGITGPTLRFKKGAGPKKLIVHLKNELLSSNDLLAFCHHPHWTNLHTHGLHVSPEEGDNVFLQVGEGAPDGLKKDLIYSIPDGHYPGTFWYHPHNHGSVALQVGNGMAGALIIEGDIDEVPEIKAAKERLFVFQQIPFNDKEPRRTVECEDTLIWDLAKHNTTINGQLKPQITMQPGEVQRWRFIHAGVKEKLTIGLNRHPLHVIAYDGITSGYMAEEDKVTLFPGYRVDVLVQAVDKPGTYFLEDFRESTGTGLLGAESTQRLADVVIGGERKQMRLPNPGDLAGLCPIRDLSQEPINQTIALAFDIRNGQFQVCLPKQNLDCGTPATNNCQPFEQHAEPILLKLNTVDEWQIDTCNKTPKPPHHPFHIHVNPFQIISIGGNPPDSGEKVYGDTLIVNKGEQVILRTRYKLFTGISVLHCHILDHEDRGMMVKINIRE